MVTFFSNGPCSVGGTVILSLLAEQTGFPRDDSLDCGNN